MNSYSCSECGKRFLVLRDFCPDCHSTDIKVQELNTGTVLHCVELIATPEPYPDQYFLVLAENDGLKFFCRSSGAVEEGSRVTVEDTEEGIICH